MADIEQHLAQHDGLIKAEAYRIAKRYRLPLDLAGDLAQVGREVLIKAHSNGYDHSRAALATYAFVTVRGEMGREARRFIGKTDPADPMLFDFLEIEDDDSIDISAFRQAWAQLDERHRQTLFTIAHHETLDSAAHAAKVATRTMRYRRNAAAAAFLALYEPGTKRAGRLGRPQSGGSRSNREYMRRRARAAT